MNGPFLRDLGTVYPYPLLGCTTTTNDHAARALIGTGLVTLGGYTPGRYRMTAAGGATLTTTVRVVNGVHHHTAHGGANATPAVCTGLAERTQAMLTVAHLAQRGAAVGGHLAHLAGAQTQRGVLTFTRDQLHGGAGAARNLRALAGLHFHAVHHAAHRDVAQRHAVAGLHRHGDAGNQVVAG